MRIQNIECQLAQGQLNRYLAGDPLSDTALTQLEAHFAECGECQAEVAMRRQTLESVASPSPMTPVATNEKPTAASPVPRFLVDALRGKPDAKPKTVKPSTPTHAVIHDEREPAAQGSSMIKPLLYSVGLAGVLLAMTAIMKDPSRVFGARAEEVLPASATIKPNAAVSKTNLTTIQPDAKPSGLIDAKLTGDVPVVESQATPVSSERITPNPQTPTSDPKPETAKVQPNSDQNVTPKTTRTRRPPTTANRKPSAKAAKRPTRTSKPASRTAKRTKPKPPQNQVRVVPDEPKSGVTVYDGGGAPLKKPN
jgi:hypothetical protein